MRRQTCECLESSGIPYIVRHRRKCLITTELADWLTGSLISLPRRSCDRIGSTVQYSGCLVPLPCLPYRHVYCREVMFVICEPPRFHVNAQRSDRHVTQLDQSGDCNPRENKSALHDRLYATPYRKRGRSKSRAMAGQGITSPIAAFLSLSDQSAQRTGL